jgi:CRISPR-associated protein Cmr4
MTVIKFYSIKNISNLHVGSGDNNYGVIDNLVQRDVNTNLPTIHSSSLKGALKEHFSSTGDTVFIETVFGKEDNKPGKWKFLTADLLSRPLRSNMIQYFNATSPEALSNFATKIKNLGIATTFPNFNKLEELANISVAENNPLVFDRRFNNAIIEDLEWCATHNDFNVSSLKPLLGEHVVLVNSNDFRELELPVIARNHLENGISENLWYEEVVPYDSRFGFFIIENDNSYSEKFEDGIKRIIQIGANASIGYGLCKIENQF